MKEENFMAVSVSKVVPLTLLLEEIANLRREKKPETQAVFVDHNAYCFGKIIELLRIRAMCKNKETLSSYTYIKDFHQERFEKIVDYLFSGESTSLMLQGGISIQGFCPITRAFKLRVGCQRMGYMDI